MEDEDSTKDERTKSAEWLAAEIEKEEKMAFILEQTLMTLNGTTQDLQHQLEEIEGAEKDWKEKYEIQAAKNRELKGNIDALKMNLRSKRARKSTNKHALTVAPSELATLTQADLNILIRKLEKEKLSLERQVRDVEWRLDQESKAYCKAQDSKKKCITEMQQTSQILKSYKKMQHAIVPTSRKGATF